MSTLRLRNLLDSTNLGILLNSINVRILPIPIKDLKILLNPMNRPQALYYPTLNKSLSLPHKNTRRTGTLL